MNAAISALIWCAVQVTALTTVVALIYLAARRVHPRAGAAAAGGGLLMVVAITLLVASPWPRWNLTELGSRANWYSARNVAHATATTSPTGNNGSESQLAHEPVAGNIALDASHTTKEPSYWQAFLEVLNRPGMSGSANEMDAAAKPRAMGWAMIVVGVLLFGGMVAAARLLWSILDVRRLARSGHEIHDLGIVSVAQEMAERLTLPCPVTLRESAELTTPATVGWRKPVILLPTTWREWNHAELRAVVAHELAHIAGRDYAAWFVARLAVVAHFYHPLVRWLASCLQLEQELAADMTAARLVGDSKQYLHSLASLALAIPATHVAGPARTLFPSRSLLMRRVEMLRASGGLISRPRRGVARYAVFAAVALAALGAAGLRGPGLGVASVFASDTASVEVAKNVERIGLEIVPPDAIYVLSGRIAELAAHEHLGVLIQELVEKRNPMEDEELLAAEIAEVMMMPYGGMDESQNIRVAIRFTTHEAMQRLRDLLIAEKRMKPTDHDGTWATDRGRIWELDPQTLIADEPTRGSSSDAPVSFAKLQNGQPAWAEEWKARKAEPVLAAVDVSGYMAKHPELLQNLQSLPEAMVAFGSLPLITETEWAVAGIKPDEKLQLNGVLECRSPESAKTVRDTLQAQLVLLKNMANMQSRVEQLKDDSAAAAQLALFLRLAKEASNILGSAQLKTTEDRVELTMTSTESTEDLATLAQQMLPPIEQARQAARQARSKNNLRHLSLAMLNYEDTYRQFPAAASHLYQANMGYRNLADAKSKYPYSWRVALLPYLDKQKLYEQYRFDEPWDSEANKKVLEQMPDVYRSPDDAPESTNTSYFVFTGPETVFPADKATKMTQITDGTSRTISMVELKRPVPWTKPEDIEFATDKPMPKLETWTPGKLIAAFVDGHVDTLALDMDEKTLRDFITKGSFGGEGLNPGGEFENPTTVPAPSKP